MYIILGMRIINIFQFFKKGVIVTERRDASSGIRVRGNMKGIYNIVFHEKMFKSDGDACLVYV